jgi:hypothetical protein
MKNALQYLYLPFHKLFFLLVFIGILLICIVSCKKDTNHDEHNFNFYNVSTSEAQQYSSGKWRFLYCQGGLAGITIIGRNNKYLQLSSNRIQIGSDSLGTILDTTLTWTQGQWGADTRNYFHYFPSPTLPYSEEVLHEIRNDTLIISDFADDGFTYYYKKF